MCERNSGRYTRSWKCQVSVGELYRWILAKLSDKDIKRALHKYRDLMPRQSDWNRKLTQATNMPEVGFRYLYRCGQIDENNHRTMQKMLKYIDRQDVLPYFDTILYNTNNSNCSIDELKRVLIDKVDAFLQYSTALSEAEVHPEEPYEIKQCQPMENLRLTRSMAKRRATDDPTRCVTVAKRARHISMCNVLPSTSNCVRPYTADEVHSLAASCCGQVRSAIMAGALGGPAVHTLLSASLISMLTVLRMTLAQALSNGASHGIANSVSSQASVNGANVSNHGSPNIHGLSPSRLLTAMPHLLALARIHLPQNLTFGPGGPLPPPGIVPRMPGQQIGGQIGRGLGVGSAGVVGPLEGQHAPWPARQVHAQQQFHQQQHATTASVLHQRHVVLFSGGVGITASSNDSCIFYYCRIRLRIRLDMGSSTEMLNLIQVERQDPYQRQLEMFEQASNLLRTRSPGEFVCDMRFNQLHHLESFWGDYLSGFLKQMLMDNLLSPTSRSFVGRNDNPNSATATTSVSTDLPADVSARWGDGGLQASTSTNSERPRSSGRSSEPREPLPPTEALAAALRALRIRTNVTGYGGGGVRGQQGDREASPDFDIHLFISRREYENGRALLMRNLRTIPSLCRLVAASNYLPAIAANAHSVCVSSSSAHVHDVYGGSNSFSSSFR